MEPPSSTIADTGISGDSRPDDPLNYTTEKFMKI